MNDNELKTIKTMLEYGTLMDLLVLAFDFAIQHNKTEIVNKYKELLTSFQNSLNDEEKTVFAAESQKVIQDKINTLKTELSRSLKPDELSSILNELKL